MNEYSLAKVQLINSIKKENMLFFVHFFKEKYYLCICI